MARNRRSGHMRTTRGLDLAMVAMVGIALLVAASQARLSAQPPTDPAIRIGAGDLGGVVASGNGPEAGVWVIAETTDLPTKFAKIVVTDDQGRYVMPDLPKATYNVWVRGYGLVDSPKVQTAPGKVLDLKASPAPDAKAAAQYYPALYWYALLQVPPPGDFPGKGMPETLKSQGQWLDIVKTDGCFTCHQLGNAATRAIKPALAEFANSVEAWEARI